MPVRFSPSNKTVTAVSAPKRPPASSAVPAALPRFLRVEALTHEGRVAAPESQAEAAVPGPAQATAPGSHAAAAAPPAPPAPTGDDARRLPRFLQADVRAIAPALGLTGDSVPLAARPGLVAEAGSRAAAARGALWFDPAAIPSEARERRGLVAHELTHHAQARVTAAPAPTHVAEREARGAAEAARAGAPIPRPRAAIEPSAALGERGPVTLTLGEVEQRTLVESSLVHASLTIVDAVWNGDRFRLTLARANDEIQPHLTYEGSDIASATSMQWPSIELTSATAPLTPTLPRGDAATAPRADLTLSSTGFDPGSGPMIRVRSTVSVPRVNTPDGRQLVLALGAGLPEIILYDDLETEPAWTPASRMHSFTLHADQRSLDVRSVTVRSRDALPASVARELEAAMPSTLHLESLTTVAALEAASSELGALLASPEAGLSGASTMTILSREVTRRLGVARGHATAGTTNPDDALWKQGAADLLLAITEVGPRLQMLQGLSDPQAFLGGEETGTLAVEQVDQTKGFLATYLFVSVDGNRERTAGCRTIGLASFARLPFLIADLYLREGGAMERLERRERDLVFDVIQARGRSGGGGRAIDRVLGLTTSSSQARGADELRQITRTLRAALDRGDATVLSSLLTATVTAQRRAGLIALLAAYEQFRYFARELDTVIDDFLGLFSRGSQHNVAADYRDRFDRLLQRVEGSRPIEPAAADGAIASFTSIVGDPQFSTDVQAIQSRIESVAVMRLVGRIVAIVAVSAIGGAAVGAGAGAALSTAARAFALGGRATFVLTRGGALVAEAGTFTLLTRTGESLLIGGTPQRSFAADFGINLAMLGVLRLAGGAYSAAWTRAGTRAHPRIYTVGAYAVTGTTAHLFGELLHVMETGRPMTGDQRTIAVVQNLALLTVLHFGRFFQQRLETRVSRGVSSLLGSDAILRTRLAALEAARVDLVERVRGVSGRTDASREEIAGLLAEIDRQFNAELGLLQDAARFHHLPAGELQAAVGRHVRAVAELELRLAQEGAQSPLGIEASFRPAAPGIVEFAPEARALLEQFYAEQGGTLTREGERLVGELSGRRIHYIPRLEAAGATAGRTAHAAGLESALGDLAGRVDILESGALPGRSARVTVRNGRVVIEVGPRTTAEDIEGHLGTARGQLRYQGPLGRLRALTERMGTLLRLRPGQGTLGAEARREVAKLRELRARLLSLEGTTAREARRGEDADTARRLADVEAQLEYYERLVDSYERGRGYVAAFDTPASALSEMRERFPADRVTVSGDRVVLNGTLDVSYSALEAMDRALGGAPRASALEELVDLSRVLAEVGGDETRLSPTLQNRLALLRGAVVDLGVRPTTPPVVSTADPLLLGPGAPIAQRVEAALARAARIARAVPGSTDATTATALRDRLIALAERARTATSPADRAAAEAALVTEQTALTTLEAVNAEAVTQLRITEDLASLQELAVPENHPARLTPEDLAQMERWRNELLFYRGLGLPLDSATATEILRGIAALRARAARQQAADVARSEREGIAALGDRERTLYEDTRFLVNAVDARALGIRPGRYHPTDLDRLTSEQLEGLAGRLTGRDPATLEALRTDLRERAAKNRHRDRLVAARTFAGRGVDAAVREALRPLTAAERRAAQLGRDVWVSSAAEARELLDRLRVLLQPGPRGEAPSFHGPESHRGTGTAPDAVHINAEGYFNGQHVDVHIYFPP